MFRRSWVGLAKRKKKGIFSSQGIGALRRSHEEVAEQLGMSEDTNNPYSLFLIELGRRHKGAFDAQFMSYAAKQWVVQIDRRKVLVGEAHTRQDHWKHHTPTPLEGSSVLTNIPKGNEKP